MSKYVLAFFSLTFVSLAFNFPVIKKTVAVDTSKSELVWRGYKVVGQHHGSIQLINGSMEFDGNKLLGGSFEIDMTTIDCSDLTGGSKNKLIGHLKSDDFFSVDEHQTAAFKVTSASRKSKGQYDVTGNLTVKGITKPVTFAAAFTTEVAGTKVSANIKVDRTLYDIKYRSGNFFDGLGDKMINDHFDLEVSLVMNEIVEL